MRLLEAYALQMQELRDEIRRSLVVHVAYVLGGEHGLNWDSFCQQMGYLDGRILEVGERGSVIVQYGTERPQLWLLGADNRYLSAYRTFSRDHLGRRLDGGFREAGFAVDHAYNRGRVLPWGDNAYHRAFLAPARANSSWGAYFEKGLGRAGRGRSGLRDMTTAILAKVAGIKAPRTRAVTTDVVAIVGRLVDESLVDEARRAIDEASLATFFGIAQHRYVGMTLSLSAFGELEAAKGHPRG